MIKKFAFALGVTTICATLDPTYALPKRERLETDAFQGGIKRKSSYKAPRMLRRAERQNVLRATKNIRIERVLERKKMVIARRSFKIGPAAERKKMVIMRRNSTRFEARIARSLFIKQTRLSLASRWTWAPIRSIPMKTRGSLRFLLSHDIPQELKINQLTIHPINVLNHQETLVQSISAPSGMSSHMLDSREDKKETSVSIKSGFERVQDVVEGSKNLVMNTLEAIIPASIVKIISSEPSSSALSLEDVNLKEDALKDRPSLMQLAQDGLPEEKERSVISVLNVEAFAPEKVISIRAQEEKENFVAENSASLRPVVHSEVVMKPVEFPALQLARSEVVMKSVEFPPHQLAHSEVATKSVEFPPRQLAHSEVATKSVEFPPHNFGQGMKSVEFARFPSVGSEMNAKTKSLELSTPNSAPPIRNQIQIMGKHVGNSFTGKQKDVKKTLSQSVPLSSPQVIRIMGKVVSGSSTNKQEEIKETLSHSVSLNSPQAIRVRGKIVSGSSTAEQKEEKEKIEEMQKNTLMDVTETLAQLSPQLERLVKADENKINETSADTQKELKTSFRELNASLGKTFQKKSPRSLTEDAGEVQESIANFRPLEHSYDAEKVKKWSAVTEHYTTQILGETQ